MRPGKGNTLTLRRSHAQDGASATRSRKAPTLASAAGANAGHPNSILAQAPCRADLAGGTLDLWPLYLFHPGAVTLNFALNVLTTCRIEARSGRGIHLRSADMGREERFRDLDELCRAKNYRHPIAAFLVRHFLPSGGFLLETHSESPAGAGISGSSALMVATAAALARFTGYKLDKEKLRALAQNVEAQIIRVPTGCQDYYPALYGGVNAVWLGAEGVRRDTVPVAAEEIDARFIVAYTGAPRQSGINNWQVFKRHIDGDRRVIRNFADISQIAQDMLRSLVKSDWPEVARLLREEWKLRRSNYPGISTPLIDQLMAMARRNGGLAAKVCGAGGGGCVLFMVAPEAKRRVQDAISNAGGTLLPARVARQGLTLTALNPDKVSGAR
jgi:D-glycero-alpha-D-manno-heptose-7-phosphate kinase